MTQPTKQIRDGAVQAAVFEKEMDGANGKFTSKSVALQIGYKKGDEWQNSKISIISRNLDKVINVLQQAKEACASGASTLEDNSIGFD